MRCWWRSQTCLRAHRYPEIVRGYRPKTQNGLWHKSRLLTQNRAGTWSRGPSKRYRAGGPEILTTKGTWCSGPGIKAYSQRKGVEAKRTEASKIVL